MKKNVILYWAPGGNVEKNAKRIHEFLAGHDFELMDLASFDTNEVENIQRFILGIATIGAEIWHDATGDNHWNDFFVKNENVSFEGKQFAFFGLGDQVLYPDHFVDALGYLKEEVEKRNGTIVGQWPVGGYTFTDSEGMADGKFFGLALDEDKQDHLTPERIQKWVEQLKREMQL
ncbi:MAG: flavodoxin [Bacteroidales bacterium]|nr:flavodoxin [Bacteroidales bacterium]